MFQSLQVTGSVWIKCEGKIDSGGVVAPVLAGYIALVQAIIHFPLPLDDRVFRRGNLYCPHQAGSRLITDSFYNISSTCFHQGVIGMPVDPAEGQRLPAIRQTFIDFLLMKTYRPQDIRVTGHAVTRVP